MTGSSTPDWRLKVSRALDYLEAAQRTNHPDMDIRDAIFHLREGLKAPTPNTVTITASLYADLIRWFERYEEAPEKPLDDEGLCGRLNDAAH